MGCNCGRKGQRNTMKGRATVGPKIIRTQRDAVSNRPIAQTTKPLTNIVRLDANRQRIERVRRDMVRKTFGK